MVTTDRQRHWLRLSRAWSRSGVSQWKFCEQRGVAFSSFTRWRCELRRRGLLEPPRDADTDAPCGSEDGTFLPVTVVPSRTDPAFDKRSIEIVIDERHVIRVRGDFDPITLRRVVAALEDPAC